MKEKIAELLEMNTNDGQEDALSLSDIIDNVQFYLLPKDAPPSALQPATLAYIRVMLENGFLVANLRNMYVVPYGAWPIQDPDYVIKRIKTEWDALGKEPNIGDICWFVMPKKTPDER